MTKIVIEQSLTNPSTNVSAILSIIFLIILAVLIPMFVYSHLFYKEKQDISGEELNDLIETLSTLKSEKSSYLPSRNGSESDLEYVVRERKEVSALEKTIEILNKING